MLSGQTKIEQEITGLSSRVASFEERLTKIELSIASITDVAPRVSQLEKAVADIREIVSKLDHKNDDLENRSRRNNLLIYGVTENSGETSDELLETVTALIISKLDVKCGDIERCHRLGVRKSSSTSPRPVIIKLLDFRTKVAILSNASKLKGAKIFINEDFSERVRQIRRELWQNSAEIRRDAKKARLHYDQLLVDNVRYSWDEKKKVIVNESCRLSATNNE